MADLTGMMQAAAGVGGVGPPFTLYLWGANSSSKWYDFSSASKSSPVQVGSAPGVPQKWNQVACTNNGAGFTLAVSPTNGLYAWGYNVVGQLGIGTTTTQSSAVQIGALNDWAQATCGGGDTDGYSLAVKIDNTLWAWGDNAGGKLGLNSTVDRSSPVQVGALSNWAQVVAGVVSTHAIKTDGTLWSWGQNTFGVLGIGNELTRSSPVQVGALSNWAQIACGGFHCLAVKTDGTLWAWGVDTFGQLGGTNTRRSSPVQVGALSNWAQVAAAQNISAAIKTDGTLWTWGSGAKGVLGNGSTADRSSPVQVGALTDWASVNCGDDGTNPYMLATKTDGTAWAWGAGASGRLGDGTTVDKNSPVQIGSLTNWAKVVDMGTYSNFGGMLAND